MENKSLLLMGRICCDILTAYYFDNLKTLKKRREYFSAFKTRIKLKPLHFIGATKMVDDES